MDGAADPPQAAQTGCHDQGSAAAMCSNCHVSFHWWQSYRLECGTSQPVILCHVCYTVAKLWQQMQETSLLGDEREVIGWDLAGIADRVKAATNRGAVMPLEDTQ